jgi:crotonobetainyl-CoA:carnitine CoA-transferase CaiB-like acyl-CoA transferase
LLAVTVDGAEQAKQFASVVGHPVPTTTTLGQLVELDLSPSDLVELEGRLRAAGVPASVVYTAHELARDEFVRSTGLYQSVHSEDLGNHEVTGLPWHFTGHPHTQFRAAPERSHN